MVRNVCVIRNSSDLSDFMYGYVFGLICVLLPAAYYLEIAKHMVGFSVEVDYIYFPDNLPDAWRE